MIDFLLTKPYLHIFTPGEWELTYKNGVAHFKFGHSDKERKKLKDLLNKEEQWTGIK